MSDQTEPRRHATANSAAAPNGWARHWEELFRHDEWNIGVVEAPISAFLKPGFHPAVRWLPPPPPGTFRADPFGYRSGDGVQIFCEEWDAATDRGRLVALDPDGRSRRLQGLPGDVHLSYPYVIEDEGEIYCAPEMWEAGEVRLYRAATFPIHWVREATLVPNFAGVDSSVFHHGGRWWLAGSNRATDPDEELWLWHAPALRGPWTPHRGNPVKSDPGGSRSAGTPFHHQGALYRPAQDCTRTYGGGIAIQRVLRLTPDEFAEETAVRLAPQPDWRWNQGLHTLSAAGDLTLLDAKRVCFMPAAFRRVLKRKALRLRRYRRAR